ncbi:hypothetical protein MTO96_015283 [Rhipicephalus appendiculatus]
MDGALASRLSPAVAGREARKGTARVEDWVFSAGGGSKWERARETCREHMWITGYIGGVKVALGLVYLWTGKSSYERNVEILGCMERDISELDMPVVILGDFNAHIEDLDGKTDRAGKLLLTWVERLDMIIVNTTEKCTGRTTWAARETETCIDYCVMTSDVFPRLSSMAIDSAGTRSLGSDHNNITLSFGAPPPSVECRLPVANRRALSDSAVDAVVELLEEEASHKNLQSYEDLQEWLQGAISTVQGSTHTTGSRARRRPKAWWDSEVAVALAARKQCCREHRHALSQGADEKDILALWNQYLEAKRKMAGMVQQKMAAVNKRLLRTIKEAGRDAAKKFWQHVKAQQRGG